MEANRESSWEVKRREQDRKSIIEFIDVLTSLFANITKRHDSIKDPATKYALFVDKLYLILDGACALLQTHMKSLDVEEKHMDRLNVLLEKLQTEMINLTDWVLSPTYSPDHGYGQSVMKQAEKDWLKNKNNPPQ
jgi:hypothetical protein